MIKKIYLLLVFLISTSILAQNTYRLPKVLILTTGADQGRGTVSDGIVLALQSFNKLGVPVRLENREILLHTEKLANYDILIIPTIKGYHDLPQKFSLTYMSDYELENINNWVKNGGTLVSDINIGRNTLKGADRVVANGELNSKNWKLSECFGVSLHERNTFDWIVTDSNMHIWKSKILSRKSKKIWQLIPKKAKNTVKVLANWQTNKGDIPAITLNKYGSGNAFLLPSFYILHPNTDGGLSNEKQINDFYAFIYQTSIGKHKYDIRFSPWKNAHTSVYCQTFDDGGNMEQYQRIFDFINKNKLPTVFFVTPEIDKKIIDVLKQQKLISIQGHSFNHPDFRKLNYFETQNELLLNRQFWQKNFSGFRFPYVSNSFWGLYSLNKLNFMYDTSIAANNMEFIRGSVVPYNIPIFKDDFFTTLDLIEISQIYKSDWYFYQKVLDKKPYTKIMQKHDAQLFKKYLIDYFEQVTVANNGVMVYLGHPMYVGISSTTLQALQDLINHLQQQDVWFASLNEVAERWNIYQKLKVNITEKEKSVTIDFLTNKPLNDFTVCLKQEPKKIKNVKDYKVIEVNTNYCIVFDVKDKTKIEIIY